MKKGGKMPPRIDGDGGIRTHVPVKAKRFRVVLVMTTSIRLRTSLSKSYLYICITFLSFCQCFYSETFQPIHLFPANAFMRKSSATNFSERFPVLKRSS